MSFTVMNRSEFPKMPHACPLGECATMPPGTVVKCDTCGELWRHRGNCRWVKVPEIPGAAVRRGMETAVSKRRWWTR